MNKIIQFFRDLIDDKEFVTFYSTYGYREGDNWKIPMRYWVHEPRELAEGLFSMIASSLGAENELEEKNFNSRMAHLVADSESREKVLFQFDDDPLHKDWHLTDEEGDFPKTNFNGVVEGVLTLPDSVAQKLLEAQGSKDGWLSFHATSNEHNGAGRVRLIEPEGISVVSDIDDTIKITELPAGSKIVVQNTFFHDFAAAPGMAESYRSMENTVFHYVSGGPWQLFLPLLDFIDKEGFPEGTMHMKSVPKNLLSPKTWSDLYKLIKGGATVGQKLVQIGTILEHFPNRKFILIGDSGEHDPEIYRKIHEKFGDQIQEIRIRDVINARENNPELLKGMTIIEAPTIQEGVSQFE
ncbi:MAG: DUF2183 domain-containing protein [Aureispira sp.]|nr:DUF2183 domain-containing protein [Aureispira sp.]